MKDEPTLRAQALEGNEILRLLVTDQASSWVVPLPLGELVIGRGIECHVRLEDSTVSRTHATIRVDPQRMVSVKDLGSANGSSLNGKPLKGEAPIKPGDVLRVGQATIYLHLGNPADGQRLATAAELKRRVVAEIERSVRNDCPCALLEVRLESTSSTALQTVVSLLRPSDTVTEVGPTRVLVLLPELRPELVKQQAQAVIDGLSAAGIRARVGTATAPLDAADAESLFNVARAAAESAPPGGVSLPSEIRRIDLGEEQVLVGDPDMARAYAMLERLAPTDISVLITGETGAGKEFAAILVHQKSTRRAGPFVTVNCAGIAPGVAEAELFGHARGAFTGAVQARAGLIESADGGTLFLDEVGELTLAVQANLLRVLETSTVVRVGEVKPRDVDVRVVAATHRDLESDVRAGRFREDLYFRIVGAHVMLPPLRRRRDEILPLARSFLRAATNGKPPPALTVEAQEALMRYTWPGNARELRNAMRYVVGTCAGHVVRPEHLPARIQEALATESAPTVIIDKPEGSSRATIPVQFRPIAIEVRDLEIQRINEALEAAEGNKTKAAALIGMPIRTFTEKMKHYGIARDAPPRSSR